MSLSPIARCSSQAPVPGRLHARRVCRVGRDGTRVRNARGARALSSLLALLIFHIIIKNMMICRENVIRCNAKIFGYKMVNYFNLHLIMNRHHWLMQPNTFWLIIPNNMIIYQKCFDFPTDTCSFVDDNHPNFCTKQWKFLENDWKCDLVMH